jgi:hypothetical protein
MGGRAILLRTTSATLVSTVLTRGATLTHGVTSSSPVQTSSARQVRSDQL